MTQMNTKTVSQSPVYISQHIGIVSELESESYNNKSASKLKTSTRDLTTESKQISGIGIIDDGMENVFWNWNF